MEIFSTALGAVGVLFALSKKDQKMLAELLGSMGIVAILSANPIMGILVIGTAVYAYKKKKIELDKSAFSKSAATSTFAMTLFGVLELPILFKLIPSSARFSLDTLVLLDCCLKLRHYDCLSFRQSFRF